MERVGWSESDGVCRMERACRMERVGLSVSDGGQCNGDGGTPRHSLHSF